MSCEIHPNGTTNPCRHCNRSLLNTSRSEPKKPCNQDIQDSLHSFDGTHLGHEARSMRLRAPSYLKWLRDSREARARIASEMKQLDDIITAIEIENELGKTSMPWSELYLSVENRLIEKGYKIVDNSDPFRSTGQIIISWDT